MHLARFTTTSDGHLSIIITSQVCTDIVNSRPIYHGSSIFVAVKNEWTSQLMVERGVLQGDPCSLLLLLLLLLLFLLLLIIVIIITTTIIISSSSSSIIIIIIIIIMMSSCFCRVCQ